MSINRCYFVGEINASGVMRIGGIADMIDEDVYISDSFVIADIKGNDNVGGIAVEDFGDLLRNSKIEDCYYSGKITANGYSHPIAVSNINISDVYFNSTTTGVTSPSSSARTTAQLKQKSTFSGWNFNSRWQIDEGASFLVLQGLETPVTIEAPTVKAEVLGTDSIKLAWNAIAGTKTYEILYGGKTVTSTTNSITISKLSPNTTYSFQVRVKNTASIGYWSKAVTAKTLQELAVPTGLKATEVTGDSVKLEWSKATNAMSYEVAYGNKEIAAAGNSLEIKDLTSGTEYEFKVRSVNGSQKSAYSVVVKVTTLTLSQVSGLAYET